MPESCGGWAVADTDFVDRLREYLRVDLGPKRNTCCFFLYRVMSHCSHCLKHLKGPDMYLKGPDMFSFLFTRTFSLFCFFGVSLDQ